MEPSLPRPRTSGFEQTRPEPRFRVPPVVWRPLLPLLLGTALTIAITVQLSRVFYAEDHRRFQAAVDRVEGTIADRMDTYTAMLRGGVGLFAASSEVTRDAFRHYVQHLELRREYPGIQGIGFSRRLRAEDVPRFVEEQRRAGVPNYRVWPPDPPRPEYHTIQFLEPLDARNQAAIGYDMFSDPVRRAAMERARDEGVPAASGFVTLVQEIDKDKQEGFLIYVPVFAGGTRPNTVEERRAALIGFVYAPFRVQDLLTGTFEGHDEPQVAFTIFDARGEAARSYATPLPAGFVPRFATRRLVDLAARPWRIEFRSSPGMDAMSRRSMIPVVLLVGFALSALSAGLTLAQQRAISTAQRFSRYKEAVRHEERLYQLAVEQVRDYAIFMVGLDGRMRTWNQGVTRVLGWTESEFIGQSFEVLFPAQDVAAGVPQRELEEAKQRDVATDGWRIRRSGERFWASGTVTALRDEDRRVMGYLKVMRDLTGQKTRDDQLRLQARVLESMTEGVSLSDESGTIVWTNEAEDRMFGYERGELVGQHVSIQNAYGTEENARVVRGVIEQLKATGNWSGEWFNKRKDGGTFYTQANITAIERDGQTFWICVQHDITEAKQAAEALAQSEARFRQLANTIPQLAWMARPDGWIFWYNQRWYDYTGTTREEMEGWGWQRAHDPAELPRVLAHFKEALAAEADLWEDTFPLRRHDGEFRWHLSRALPLRDAHGRIVMWFGTNTDITEQRELAEQRERLLEVERAARAEAERVGRMKDEFLATLSHELRTPLNAILGWSEILARGPSTGTDMQRGLETIVRNARAQAKIIEDLLDMSSIVSGKVRLDVQTVDLGPVVDASVDVVRPMADAKGVTLETTRQPGSPLLRGDPNRLQQVVWNLLTNAVKFTPRGGHVRVDLATRPEGIELCVHDTGQGIRPEFLPHVFERFRQADASTTRRHGGLGLGLSIVRSLVELHGGNITVSSPGLGLGSTFVVRLPSLTSTKDAESAPDTEPMAGDALQPARARRLRGAAVLFVDDDPDTRDVVRLILEGAGAEVMLAATAADALDVLRGPGSVPDVLVSDIAMPDMDGYAFIRQVRALRPEIRDVPAIALTSYASEHDAQRAMAAGYQKHQSKPIDGEAFVDAVAELWRARTSGVR